MSRSFCLLLVILVTAAQAQESRSTRPERRPVREPEYVGQPLYAEFIMAPTSSKKGRMWAVLDKSKPDGKYYDVLYIDRDCDGDLTDEGERIVGKYSEKGARAGMAIALRTGDLAVPGTKLVHEKFLVSTVRKAGRKGIWFRMKWNGRHEVSGGYGDFGSDTTMWSKTPANAPVIAPDPNARLTFATWGAEKVAITAGASSNVNVIIGNPGSGPDTLAVVDENFVDLEAEKLLVTVIAKDAYGKKVEARSRLTEHC